MFVRCYVLQSVRIPGRSETPERLRHRREVQANLADWRRRPACRNGDSSVSHRRDNSFLKSQTYQPHLQTMAICSRPCRSVFAIQISSFRNLSIRRMKESSRSRPSDEKAFCTLEKLTSQKMVTSPSSRITGTRF